MSCIAGFLVGAGSNAVGTLMVDYLVKPVERRIRYMFRFHKIVEEFQEQKTNLTVEQTQVKAKVGEAKLQIQTQVIEDYVEDWLKDAENVLNDVQSLGSRIDENKRCFHWCPNWYWRYRLSKKIDKKMEGIRKLVDRSSKFERYGHRADLPGLEFQNEGYMAAKSSVSALNKIMGALKDGGVSIIGVWGMGGVGKTTLVTEVGKKAKELQLFGRVIKVVVSRDPDIGNIQDKIADFLDFKFEKKTEEGKAEELWIRLKKEEKKKEEKVLIILDDMWKELDLKKIGIPVLENGKGCTIILTTRNRQACESMRSQVTLQLDVLSEDEAWNLFRTNASLGNAATDIIEVAAEVAKVCGGLPIAIVTLARALKSKDLHGWKLARTKIQRSRLMYIQNVEDEKEKNAYLCLEISYSYLRSIETKRCFLLCGLYPEDYSIDVEDLVRYALALKIYQNAESVQEVRSEVLEAIKTLKDSCLLLGDDRQELEGDKERYLKVHDLVRDVAMRIASKEDKCSKQKLEILLDHCYNETSVDYFEGMPELKVLSIKAASDESPFSLNSLKSLTNLRALELEGFKHLEGIADLASLRELEILSLKGSGCGESIDILGDLKNLRVFDLRGSNFNSISISNLIRRFDQLEELYLCPKDNAAILPVINLLPRLDSLSLEEVRSLEFPEGFIFPARLQRYEIAINMKRDKEIISSRSLRISNTVPLNVIEELLWSVVCLDLRDIEEKGLRCLIDAVQMKKAEKNGALLLPKLKFFYLFDLPYLEYIWKMPTQRVSLGSLEIVYISGCGKLKSLFSLSMAQSLVRLHSLRIEGCDELAQIVEVLVDDETSAEVNPGCFPELRSLEIKGCRSLEYMFPDCMASQEFTKLQKLSMRRLSNLKQICGPAKQNKENSNLLFPSLTELKVLDCSEFTDTVQFSKPVKAYLKGFQLSKLKEAFFMNIKDLTLKNIEEYNLIPEADPKGLNGAFSNLEYLKLIGCKKLKSLFSPSIVHSLQKLEELHIYDCSELKTVFADQLENDDGGTKSNNPLCLPKLTSLQIAECERLEYVLPITLAQAGGLPGLEKLEILRCGELKTVFVDQRKNDDGGTKSNNPLSLPKLTSLGINKCPILEYVLPITLAQAGGLPQLEELFIENCSELKTVFVDQLEDDGGTKSNNPLCLPKLASLLIRYCRRLEYVLPITLAQAGGLPQLQNLPIFRCGELKTIFADQLENDGGGTKSNNPLYLPKLTSLDIKYCRRLEYVFPITLAQAGGLPRLESVDVSNCTQLKHVFGGGKEDDGVGTCIQLPRLKNLSFNGVPNLSGFGPENCFVKAPPFENRVFLKDFEEVVDDVVSCNSQLRERSPNLVIFEQLLQSPNLETLKLSGLVLLRYIWKGPIQAVPTNLTWLYVYDCNSLTYIFPVIVIRNLPNLSRLTIQKCEKLQQILGNDNVSASSQQGLDQDERGVKNEKENLMIPQLKQLSLNGLPSLVRFSPAGYHLVFPSLDFLEIKDCSRMITSFTQDSDSKVHAKTEDFEEVAVSCNSQLRERSPNLVIFEQLLESPNLETLKLDGLVLLRYIWNGPNQAVLTNLTRLHVYDCNSLTYIFPVIVIRNLPNLSRLKIQKCEKLQQILGNDDMSASSSKQGLDQDERGVIKNEKEILMIPQLKKLKLERLASLVRFSPVGYHLVFPCLDFLEIKDCPRMITSFTQDSDSKVHAKTEARRLDDPSPSKLKISWQSDREMYRKRCWPLEYDVENDSLPLYVEEADEISAKK